VRRADEQDFHEFVVAASPDLSRLARMLAADSHAGEDLLQATLLKTWSAWPRVRRADNPNAYVRRVMVNAAAKAGRRRWRGEIPTHVIPDSPTADSTKDVDDRRVLVRAVRELPPRQRAAIVLRYFLDLGDEEVAEILDCSVATVRSQISRALARMRVSSQDDSMRVKGSP
jgi:RNA polymerase sigma-70 factor (sigma-E family)